MPKGEKNKLSKTDKAKILQSKGAESAYALAEEFGVSHTMIYKIWKSPEKYQTQVNGSLGPGIDTKILKKLIPVFAQVGVKVKFKPEELARIQQLAEEVL